MNYFSEIAAVHCYYPTLQKCPIRQRTLPSHSSNLCTPRSSSTMTRHHRSRHRRLQTDSVWSTLVTRLGYVAIILVFVHQHKQFTNFVFIQPVTVHLIMNTFATTAFADRKDGAFRVYFDGAEFIENPLATDPRSAGFGCDDAGDQPIMYTTWNVAGMHGCPSSSMRPYIS